MTSILDKNLIIHGIWGTQHKLEQLQSGTKVQSTIILAKSQVFNVFNVTLIIRSLTRLTTSCPGMELMVKELGSLINHVGLQQTSEVGCLSVTASITDFISSDGATTSNQKISLMSYVQHFCKIFILILVCTLSIMSIV